MSDLKWCPTQGGTYTAYEPQYKLAGTEEWKVIKTDLVIFDDVKTRNGIPFPLACGGISLTIGLCGYAQAQALAWQCAARAEAEGHHVEVRVQPYEVVYEIKARRLHQEVGA